MHDDDTIDTSTIDTSTNVGAALDFAKRHTAPDTITVEFEKAPETIIVTTGTNGATALTPVRDLFAKHASAPERRAGTIITHSLGAFVDLVNRDKRPDSVIFADIATRMLTAVLDFHGPADSAPRFGRDRVLYAFNLSPQLTAWIDATKRPMAQREFSRFIDDHLGDVGEGGVVEGSIAHEFARRRCIKFAAPSDLIVFTRTIAAKSTTESEEIVDENTGDVSIQYKKKGDVKTPDGSPIPVPQAFTLKIPILNGPEATEFTIAVRLRYDIGDRGIAWTIELHALDKYILAAIEEAVAIVRRPEDVTKLAAEVLTERKRCAEIAARHAKGEHDAEEVTDEIVGAPIALSYHGGCGLPVYLAAAP